MSSKNRSEFRDRIAWLAVVREAAIQLPPQVGRQRIGIPNKALPPRTQALAKGQRIARCGRKDWPIRRFGLTAGQTVVDLPDYAGLAHAWRSLEDDH